MHHRSFLKTNFTPMFFTQQEVHNLTSTSFLKHFSKGFSDPNPIWPARYQESKEFGVSVIIAVISIHITPQTGSQGPKFLYIFIITQHHQVATQRDYNFLNKYSSLRIPQSHWCLDPAIAAYSCSLYSCICWFRCNWPECHLSLQVVHLFTDGSLQLSFTLQLRDGQGAALCKTTEVVLFAS